MLVPIRPEIERERQTLGDAVATLQRIIRGSISPNGDSTHQSDPVNARRHRPRLHRTTQPSRIELERYRSGQPGQTVNLLAYAYGGSNPPLSTIHHPLPRPPQARSGCARAATKIASSGTRGQGTRERIARTGRARGTFENAHINHRIEAAGES